MLSLIIVSVLSCSNPDAAILQREYPELLAPPIRSEFVDYAHYTRAAIMFEVCDHWSINEQYRYFPYF